MTFDPQVIRKDFPILQEKAHGKSLAYLDNAATTQKPRQVIEAITHYYETMNANIHRGAHYLADKGTDAYEASRQTVQKFINAAHPEEIIFTSGTTSGVNLVAQSWGEANIGDGDEVALPISEHHSNLLPWQQLCKRKSAKLRFIPCHDDGTLDVTNLENLIHERTKLVCLSGMTNTFGVIMPVEKIIAAAHAVGAKVLVDGAQSVPHLGADVQKSDCDFLVFSGHKMFGPTGIGLLYGKRALLEAMSPVTYGGGMVRSVTAGSAEWADLPQKFEAGTPHIAGVIGLKPAIEYIDSIGVDRILQHERMLVQYARERLSELRKLQLYGPQDIELCGGIVAFNVPGVHSHDTGSILDREGIAIRSGLHCAHPFLGNDGGIGDICRISFAAYNTREEVDAVIEALRQVYMTFQISL